MHIFYGEFFYQSSSSDELIAKLQGLQGCHDDTVKFSRFSYLNKYLVQELKYYLFLTIIAI